MEPRAELQACLLLAARNPAHLHRPSDLTAALTDALPCFNLHLHDLTPSFALLSLALPSRRSSLPPQALLVSGFACLCATAAQVSIPGPTLRENASHVQLGMISC